ncbi:MAG: hypothetical protein OXP71_06850 [Candidatus Poribacteria bacterium]|nr:hypothetical protein [Candidatus Poribacteria bacterium]
MWVLATYQPTTFFSLKPSNATSSGGKTLLTPTPYAIKMGLLDAAIRTDGIGSGEEAWQWIRGLSFAVRVPERALVNNVFTRILKPTRSKGKNGYDRTIGYREYVHFAGNMKLGFEIHDNSQMESLKQLLPHITYFGKRGGFFQFLPPIQQVEGLPSDFTPLGEQADTWHIQSQLQHLDDCDDMMTFEQADIYSGKNIRVGKERRTCLAMLPYRLRKSSRGFSDYERLGI